MYTRPNASFTRLAFFVWIGAASMPTCGTGPGVRQTETGDPRPAGRPSAARKRLIGWPEEGAQGTPANLIAKWDHVETLPFDGHVIFLPHLQFHNLMTPGSVLTYQQAYVDSRLAELSLKFKRVKHNYLMAWCNRAEFFDDALWPTIVQNFAHLAKAARITGISGIVFDNEQYIQPVWDYPLAVNHAATHTIDQYRAQVRLRGKQVMAAMIAEFPNIEVLTSHGPFWSEPKYDLTPNPV